ncbi:MAG: efflux RND transporter permease subunit [Sinimarinibacterium flocculans]|uniref:efflux RND transporter permease subunit n=1 Tax=Sinimarinibacterium flocculans TaxID=985250 RepID=UPI003C5AA27B
MRVNAETILRVVEPALYSPRGRRISVVLLVLMTALMAVQALRLEPDASFGKTVPTDHPYMQVFEQYRGDVGGANAVLVALLQDDPADGEIYNERFLASLKLATSEVEFTRGIDRTELSSIFTRNVRFLEVVENGGFRSEDVIPASYAPSPEMFALIREHVGKAGVIGRLVANDQRGALVYADVLERDPETDAGTDLVHVAENLEDKVRGQLTSPDKYVLRLTRDYAHLAAGSVVAERYGDPGWRRWLRSYDVHDRDEVGGKRVIEVPGRLLTVERVDNPAYHPGLSVHIIGFAKVVGDVSAATQQVMLFFVLTLLGTFVVLWVYLRDLRLAWLPMLCSIVAVIWELGLLRTAGFGLDPFAIMVPFLVLAISTSHGVQYVNFWADEIVRGRDPFEASRQTFRRLFIPGSIALITNVAGFLTIALVPIGVIREMSINACLGMLAVIVTNKLMMPIWLSTLRVHGVDGFRARRARLALAGEALWQRMAVVTTRPVAAGLLTLAAVVLAASWHLQDGRIIGDAQTGVPELRPDSVYNVDSRAIARNFSIATDVFTVIAEADPWSCIEYEALEQIDRFAWHLRNTEGVTSSRALPDVARKVYSGFWEGHIKQRVLPRNRDSLVLATKPVETRTGLLNVDCSAMPVYLYTTDHRASTIHRITDAVQRFNQANAAEYYAAHPQADAAACAERLQLRRTGEVAEEPLACPVHFAMASGNVGVMAATNEVIEDNELRTVLWVYAVIGVLLVLSYRSLAGVAIIGVPLFLVTIFANALMAVAGIGLKVATLPVVTLAVGIGVDYGIYVYDVLRHQLDDARLNLRDAYVATLRQTGKAVIFTGLCLAGGVFAWLFSGLQFQRDMGLLLVVMFSANMLGAVLLGPAIARFVLRPRDREPM